MASKAIGLLASKRLYIIPRANMYGNLLVKNRDIVGYGINGEPIYFDRAITPCPGVRFRENTTDVIKLREKEQGDWNKLTIDEKKELYRASFCLTYSEMNAKIPYWKNYISTVLLMSTLSLWFFIWTSRYVFDEVPITYTKEYQEGVLKNMVESGYQHITGPGGYWDYEKKQWK